MLKPVLSTLLALAIFSCNPLPAPAQAFTTVQGSRVGNGTGALLTSGAACFSPYNSAGVLTAITPSGGSPSTGPFCASILNGAFLLSGAVPNLATASPSGLNYQLVIYNNVSAPVLTVDWLTSVSGAAWTFDTTPIPVSLNSLASASGIGAPYLPCIAGASYARTDVTQNNGWQCRVNGGPTFWFQQGNQPAPGPGQTATIPVVAAMIAAAIAGGIPTTCTTGCVQTAPSTDQVITQPLHTTLIPNSFGNVMYMNPLSGVDLITQANAAFSACLFGCKVVVPQKLGCWTTTSGTVVMNQPGQMFVGNGLGNTCINHSGSAPFLTASLNSGNYTIAENGEIGGFTLNFSNSSNSGISSGSWGGLHFRDLAVIGPAGQTYEAGSPGTSQCMKFQNTYHWEERAYFDNVHLGGCAINMHVLAPTGAGTASYGYWLVNGLWTNMGAGSKDLVVDVGADLYHVLGWSMNINSGGTTTADEAFHIEGRFTGQNFHLTAENASAPVTFAHLPPTGIMQLQGDYSTFGQPVNNIEDNTGTVGGGMPPFWIMPKAGLTGIAGSVGGAGTITGYGLDTGLGLQDVQLIPSEILNPSDPGNMAYRAYMVKTGTSSSAPVDVYGTQVEKCSAVRADSSITKAISVRECIDRDGNVRITGTHIAGIGYNAKVGPYSINGLPVLQSKSAVISADGDVILASSTNLAGTFYLTFNGPFRNQYVEVGVGSTQFDTNVSLSVPVNNSQGGQVVLSNLRIKLSAGGAPQLVATIGNRNAGTSLVVTQIGDGAWATDLLPGGTPGATATTNTQTHPWSCQPGLGDGTNAIPAATYLQTSCRNETGATITLSAIRCVADAGASTCNATNGAGTGLLTGAITGSPAYTTGTQSATVTIPPGDFAKISFVADGTSKQIGIDLVGSY